MTRETLMSILAEANLPELEYRADEYWNEDERIREGLTEIQYLKREAEWVVEDYTEDTGHFLHDEWKAAKALIRRTKNGTRIPISTATFRPLDGYTPDEIQRARDIIDEVNRTKAFIRKLSKME